MATRRSAAAKIWRWLTAADQPKAKRSGAARERRAWVKQAMRTTKRNPSTRRKRRNPAATSDARTLRAARRMSTQFHGTAGEVVELSAKERRLPRYGVVVGDVQEVVYDPGRYSKRGGSLWRHRAGDRGAGRRAFKRRAKLIADPLTGRVHSVGGSARFSSRRGIVG